MSTSICLDDTDVAALAAGEPSSRDRLLHLEGCADCRELVSAAIANRTELQAPDAKNAGEARRLAPGTVLGHHRIERPLGSGGMGVVYLARDLELGREVAIKLLRAGHAEAHEQLGRESQVLAKLNHANVVTAHEVGRYNGATYLVMEYVDGGTMRDWLVSATRSADEIARIYAQAARGLAAAHAAGIVHRDVKPDNVLVGKDDRARISDFGLAGGKLRTGVVAGTPRYMAPEVLAGAPADARSDQWGLAASLWESVFGDPVFRGTTRGEIAAAIAAGLPAFPTKPHTPRWLRRAIARGLRVDPTARFDSLDRFADSLAPVRSPLRRTAPVVFGVAIVAAVSGAMVGARDRDPACGGELAEAYGHGRAALVQHFTALGARGVEVASVLGPALDHYAERWTSQRADVCRASPDDPTAVRQAACLDRRRRAFAAVVDELAAIAPGELDHAVAAAAQLPALQDCTAVERLAGREPEPTDHAAREQLAALEQQYDTARTRHVLGERGVTLVKLRAVADAANELGYYPLVADALGVVGRSEGSTYDSGAFTTLQRAMAAAQAGGDDRQISSAALDLVIASLLLARPPDERDALRSQAAAMVQRLSWRRDPSAQATEQSLMLAFGRDDLARGHLDTADRELRRSIAIGITLFGARSPNLSLARTTLAQLETKRHDYDAAAVLLAESLDVDGELWQHLAGTLNDLSGNPAQAIVDAAQRLHDVGREAPALAFVRRARANAPTGAASVVLRVMLDDLEAEIATSRGDLATARALNERSFAALGPNAVPAHLAGLRITRAEILEAAGDLPAAETEYRAALPALGDDKQSLQTAHLGLARCLAARGDLAGARALVEKEVAADVEVPRLLPGAWLLAADLRWRAGDRDGARDAARAARDALAHLPELADIAAALDRWTAAHS